MKVLHVSIHLLIQCSERLTVYYNSVMLSLEFHIRQVIKVKKQKYYDCLVYESHFKFPNCLFTKKQTIIIMGKKYYSFLYEISKTWSYYNKCLEILWFCDAELSRVSQSTAGYHRKKPKILRLCDVDLFILSFTTTTDYHNKEP